MRVQRTFSFLDLCGFTAFTDGHGDAEAVAVLGHLRAVLRAEAEARGVRVTKWLGDGAMLSGVDPEAVIACTVAVRDVIERDGRLSLRAGVSVGDVIMFEGDDYIGATVNVAARLCRAAAAGHVLVAGELRQHLPPGAAVTLLGSLSVKGLETRVRVLDVGPTGERPAGARALRPAG